MWGTFSRDQWIKENIPAGCDAGMKLAFEVIMRQAYDEGYKQAKKDVKSQAEADKYSDL